MAKTLQAAIDAVLTIPGICAGEPFQSITGGEVSSETTRDRDPGAQFDGAITAPATISNVVLSVTWNETRHRPLKSKLDNGVSRVEDAVVGKIIRDKTRARVGMDTFAPCVLVRVAGPDGDTNSNEAGKLTVELAPNGLG